MSATDDGGPAFPCYEQWSEWSELKANYEPRTGPRGGMSLRDYFAAQAMNAQIYTLGISEGSWNHSRCAELAYAFADAMLAERAK